MGENGWRFSGGGGGGGRGDWISDIRRVLRELACSSIKVRSGGGKFCKKEKFAGMGDISKISNSLGVALEVCCAVYMGEV